MKIEKDEVRHIAKLSRLEFDEKEQEKFLKHFESVLENFEVLKKINTDGVPPTAHVLDQRNVLREDVAGVGMERAKLIANAPDSEDGAYLVPRVVE